MQAAGKKEIWEWTKYIIIAVLLALIIRTLIAQPFVVLGPSMLPTLHTGERIIASKVQNYYSEPLPGEIIVLKATLERDFVKRVIAVAGDEVRVDYDGVYINGEILEEPYVLELAREPYGPVTVPEGTVFAMGDNRNNSMDSRHPSVGFIPLRLIKGKAVLVYWPLNKIRLLTF